MSRTVDGTIYICLSPILFFSSLVQNLTTTQQNYIIDQQCLHSACPNHSITFLMATYINTNINTDTDTAGEMSLPQYFQTRRLKKYLEEKTTKYFRDSGLQFTSWPRPPLLPPTQTIDRQHALSQPGTNTTFCKLFPSEIWFRFQTKQLTVRRPNCWVSQFPFPGP